MTTWRERWLRVRWTVGPYVPILVAGLVIGFVLSLVWLWQGMQ